MRRIGSILLFLLAATAAGAQNLLWNDGIRGPVRAIVQKEYTAEHDSLGNWVPKELTSTTLIHCDTNGRLLEQVTDDPGYRDSFARFVYEYDSDERCKARRILYLNGALSVANYYFYDRLGRPAKIKCFDGVKRRNAAICIIEYPGDGKIHETVYDLEIKGHPVCWRYVYNMEGDMLCSVWMDGKPESYHYTSHDQYGNWLEQLTPSTDRITVRTITYW